MQASFRILIKVKSLSLQCWFVKHVSHDRRSKRQIYSASPKLKLISDQPKFVLKAGLCVSLSKQLVYINRLCQLLHVIIYVEKARDSWERVIWWYFARIKCGNIVPGWLWIVLSEPRTWLIMWFPEVVDRQISGMSWRSCYKNIVYKHENAL